MNRNTPGLPVHHQLPESTQSHVHWVGDAIQPSHPLLPPLLPSIFPASGSFQMSQLFSYRKKKKVTVWFQSWEWFGIRSLCCRWKIRKREIPNAVWSHPGISNLQRTNVNLKMKTSVSRACHPASSAWVENVLFFMEKCVLDSTTWGKWRDFLWLIVFLAISCSRKSSQPRDRTRISGISRRVLYHSAIWDVATSSLFWNNTR